MILMLPFPPHPNRDSFSLQRRPQRALVDQPPPPGDPRPPEPQPHGGAVGRHDPPRLRAGGHQPQHDQQRARVQANAESAAARLAGQDGVRAAGGVVLALSSQSAAAEGGGGGGHRHVGTHHLVGGERGIQIVACNVSGILNYSRSLKKYNIQEI